MDRFHAGATRLIAFICQLLVDLLSSGAALAEAWLFWELTQSLGWIQPSFSTALCIL